MNVTFLGWLKVTAVRVLLMAVLALAVLLLAVERLSTSRWPQWLAASLPAGMRSATTPAALPGLFPLCALIVIVLAGYSVYVWLPWLSWLVPVIAGAASIMLVIDLPEALNHGKAVPVNLWARVPATLVFVILFAKFLLLHRHATREYARRRTGRHASGEEAAGALLPSQQRYLKELHSLIIDRVPGRVLPLVGRAGEGKSFLVQRLKHEWVGIGDLAVVLVDVWRQQRESDLQAAILEALYSHRAYLARLGWLQVPASFLLARWIAALREARSNLELGLKESKARIELKFDVPGIQWQTHFERATARWARRGGSTVVVLDELDRAAPAVTQATLTLARRSVEVAGVTVVIPYIRSHIRFKAFNPLQQVLPDLGSSMDAILYEEYFGTQSNTGQDGDRPDTILRFWEVLRDGKFWKLQPGEPADSGNGQGAPTAQRPPASDETLAMALRYGVFADARPLVRDRLQARFEEKYLSAAGLSLHPPEPEDVVAMVTGHFPTLVRKVRDLLPLSPAAQGAQPDFDQLEDAVLRGLRNWLESQPQLIGPPIRALEGVLHESMEQAVFIRRSKGTVLSPREVATLVVAAYDTAGLIHGITGGSS